MLIREDRKGRLHVIRVYSPVKNRPGWSPPPPSGVRAKAIAGHLDPPGTRFVGALRRCDCGAHKFGWKEFWLDPDGEIQPVKVRIV